MLYRFRRRLYHLFPKLNVELMYVHNLDVLKQVEPKINLKFFKLSSKDIYRIWDVKKLPLNKLKSRLESGDVCYTTEIEKYIASYHWVQYNGRHFIQQANEEIKIKNDECWIYHTRVSENFRGNKINSFVLSKILNEAKNMGLDKAWIYTNKSNYANRKGLQELGFELKSKIYSVEINKKFYQYYKIELAK